VTAVYDIASIAEALRDEEGYERFAYEDHLGYVTVGIGRCLEPGRGYGIDEEEAEYLLRRDIERMAEACEKSFSYWHDVSMNIRETVIMLCFQMGVAGFQRFSKTNRAISQSDFDLAANELLNSKFAQQTPARAERMAERLRAG
jgi:lysozyme